MKKLIAITALLLCSAFVCGQWEPPTFLRGDANADGVVDMSDAVFTSTYLQYHAPWMHYFSCPAAADFTGDGVIDGWDIYYLTQWLFNSGAPPPAPGPFNCGEGPLYGLPCYIDICPD